MKIGLLAYHSACNFGATLQLLSSYMYWKNEGHNPIVINWVSTSLEDYYKRVVPAAQQDLILQMRAKLWHETNLCRTDEEVAAIIQQEGIQAVVVGSDAVCQHHTIRERIVFPCRRIIYVRPITEDMQYCHNPFWGSFNKYLKKPIPIAVISASNQDSQFQYFGHKLCKQMAQSVSQYAYLSVRDSWTAQMFAHITQGVVVPPITPDPVFAFNENAADLIPSKKEIVTKYGLSDRYILYSFIQQDIVSQQWITDMETIAAKNNVQLVRLPFSHRESFGESTKMIHLPISPLDWYALIKYSQGYVGNNMHPIVVALHNAIPFFSFDTYGKVGTYLQKGDDTSSKILHLIQKAGFQSYRISCIQKLTNPSPQTVWDLLLQFPRHQSEAFAKDYYAQYVKMMKEVQQSIHPNT